MLASTVASEGKTTFIGGQVVAFGSAAMDFKSFPQTHW